MSRKSFGLERRFALIHPATMMAFFISAIVLTLLSYHPKILLLSFVLAAASVTLYLGVKVLLQSLAWLIPMATIVVLFNTLFNRRGATELITIEQFTFTLESLLFGLSIALMLSAIILWFRLYQEFMTSDRFLYLFAPLAPTTALSISMVQRQIPLTKHRWQQIRTSNRMLGGMEVREHIHSNHTAHSPPCHSERSAQHVVEESQTSQQFAPSGASRPTKLAKFRSLTRQLSALMSWSMEDAIQAADSMQARGYSGSTSKKQKRRSSFRSFRLTSHDAIATIAITALTLTAGLGIFFSTRELAFFPILRGTESLSTPALIAAVLVMFFPLFIEGKEQLRWLLSAYKT